MTPALDVSTLRRCQACGAVKGFGEFAAGPNGRPFRMCHDCRDEGRTPVPMGREAVVVCACCGRDFVALPYYLLCSRCHALPG